MSLEPTVTDSALEPGSCLLGAFLCAWSDVMGPALLHAWTRPGGWGSETRGLYQQLSKICLSCRVAQQQHHLHQGKLQSVKCRRIAHQILHLPALSVALFSFAFEAQAPTAFVLVFPPEGYAASCLPWRPLVCDFFDRHLRLLRARHRLGLPQVLPSYATLLEQFSDLTQQLRAPPRLPVDRVPLSRTALAPDRNVEPAFLSRAIEGHLAAQGRSLVVGRDREQVNLILLTLALFNSPAERACSALMPEAEGPGGDGGCPDSGGHFFLQGGAPPTAVSPGHCLASPRPLCVVQLKDRSVRRCCLQPVHALARHCERRALLCGGERRRFAQSGLLTDMSAVQGSEVQALVHRLLSLPPAAQRPQLRLFQQRRAKQARLLLHMTDCLPDRIPAVVAQLRYPASEVRRLVSLAETLRPGAAALLCGDPRAPGGGTFEPDDAP